MTTVTRPARVEPTELGTLAEGLGEEERTHLAELFPRLSTVDALAVLDQRPDATEVHTYMGWRHLGRQVRHGDGEVGIILPNRPGKPHRARVFDIDQTDEADPLPRVAVTAPRKAQPMTLPATSTGPPGPVTLATCSFTEFRPDMGTPVRFTVGYPRFLKLDYQFAGYAKLITPTRPMLSMSRDAYRVAYRRHLDSAGIAAIRAELHRIAVAGGRVVLLCFERLNERDKRTGAENWCHRTMFAGWWESQTGQHVPELGATAGPPPGRPFEQATLL